MPIDIGGALGGIGSFLGNQVSSAINSSRAWKYAQRAMSYQDQLNRAYNQWSLENNPSFSRSGFVKAGYNPLLALGSQISSQNAGISPSFMNADSDAGDQAINSALSSLNSKEERKIQKLNQRNIQLNNEHQELENEKLRNENATSARNVIGNIITGNDDPTVNKIKESYKTIRSTLSNYGIKLPDLPVENIQPSSAVSSQKKRNLVIPKDDYVYVQKGVPRSVIKKFEKADNTKYKVKYVKPDSKKKVNYKGKPNEINSSDWYGYVDFKNVWR